MGDEQTPEMRDASAGTEALDEQTREKDSASDDERNAPDPYYEVADFEAGERRLNPICYELKLGDNDLPWTRYRIDKLLLPPLVRVGYTELSLDDTSSEDIVRILTAELSLELTRRSLKQKIGTVADVAAAERARDRVRSKILTLKLKPTLANLAGLGEMTAPGAAAKSSELPQIVVTTDQKAVVDAAEQALVQRGGIYVRGRSLVHVIHDKSSSDWLTRPEGMPVVEALAHETLREILGACAKWIKLDPKGVPHAVMVPTWAVDTLMARGEWGLSALEGIATTPVFRADGSILDAAGYDASTRLIYDPCGTTYPEIPLQPTKDDAEQAYRALLDPFVDVCYVGDSDRAATVALILSMVGRAAIDGPVPMFGAVAPTPGSGKGLVMELASLIATGRKPPLMAPTDNDDETRKRLLALAIEAPSLVVIDNVEGQLGSPSLAMALTTGEIRDRVLGKSQTITATLRAVWGYTGNNVALRGDLGRRVVPIGLDPKMEHPEDRKDWRYPDVARHVRDNRPSLVVAALTVLRGYVVAGRPHGDSRKGSFGAWDDLVRGAIVWAAGVDPLDGVQRIRDEGDSDLDNLRTLLATWYGAHGSEPRTARELVGDACMRDALMAYKPAKVMELDSTALGYALRRLKDRMAGGLRLERAGETRSDAATWRVVKT